MKVQTTIAVVVYALLSFETFKHFFNQNSNWIDVADILVLAANSQLMASANLIPSKFHIHGFYYTAAAVEIVVSVVAIGVMQEVWGHVSAIVFTLLQQSLGRFLDCWVKVVSTGFIFAISARYFCAVFVITGKLTEILDILGEWNAMKTTAPMTREYEQLEIVE